MTDTSFTITDLQSKWGTLHDLDRARAVRAIHRSGTSLNELAKALKCSPSLLRHLLKTLQAPQADQSLARNGKLTTNQLVRRAQAAEVSLATKQREAEAVKRTQASLLGCKAICDWVADEGLAGPFAGQIIGKARWVLAAKEENKTLPRDAAPPHMPVKEIIQKCRPTDLKTYEIYSLAWFVHWFTLWAAYSMTDSWVRYKAIELALEKQLRR